MDGPRGCLNKLKNLLELESQAFVDSENWKTTINVDRWFFEKFGNMAHFQCQTEPTSMDQETQVSFGRNEPCCEPWHHACDNLPRYPFEICIYQSHFFDHFVNYKLNDNWYN